MRDKRFTLSPEQERAEADRQQRIAAAERAVIAAAEEWCDAWAGEDNTGIRAYDTCAGLQRAVDALREARKS